MDFKLIDHGEGRKPARGSVHENPGGLDIRVEGYGSNISGDGNGCPIFLEKWEGKLRLIVWADINSEEPTHIIDLEGARESARKPDAPTPEGIGT
jgi:hypothetical protein